MSIPSYLGPLFDDSTPDDFAAREEARFEDDAVHYLLTQSQQFELKRQMLQESRESYGSPQLSFAALRELLPFPIFLQAEKIPGVAEDMPLYRVFERFVKLKLWRHWQALLEARPEAFEATGLVFHYPYLKASRLRDGRGGALVLHDYQGYDGDAEGVRMTYHPPEGKPLHLETFARLLTIVTLNGWQP
jgi:hypothetical protein